MSLASDDVCMVGGNFATLRSYILVSSQQITLKPRDLTNSKAHFPAELADLSLHEKGGEKTNNEGSIAQQGRITSWSI